MGALIALTIFLTSSVVTTIVPAGLLGLGPFVFSELGFFLLLQLDAMQSTLTVMQLSQTRNVQPLVFRVMSEALDVVYISSAYDMSVIYKLIFKRLV